MNLPLTRDHGTDNWNCLLAPKLKLKYSKGLKIPLLEDVLNAIRGKGVLIYIEVNIIASCAFLAIPIDLKNTNHFLPGYDTCGKVISFLQCVFACWWYSRHISPS